MRALIAEDSQIMRKIVKTNLQKLSVNRIYESVDGNAAFATLNANADIDLLFTDLNMPNLNGLEFCKKIKQSGDKFKNLRIIVISEHLSDTVRESFLTLGISHFVPKPFDLKAFNDVVIPLIEDIKNGVLPKDGVDMSKDEFVKKIKEEQPLVSINEEELTINFNKMSVRVSLDKLLEAGKIKSDDSDESGKYVELKDKQ
ncbi:MAG: response regulator [Campylobacterales bacterium]